MQIRGSQARHSDRSAKVSVSVFISSFHSVCFVPSWHGVCFVTYSSLASGFASAPHLRPSAPNSQYAPSPPPEPKTYRSVFFPISLSCFICRVTLLLQVRLRQSFFRAEPSVNNSTDTRRLLHCQGAPRVRNSVAVSFDLFAPSMLLLQVWKCCGCQRARWQQVSAPGNFVLTVTTWSCF